MTPKIKDLKVRLERINEVWHTIKAILFPALIYATDELTVQNRGTNIYKA
jgi:hypothetical protein